VNEEEITNDKVNKKRLYELNEAKNENEKGKRILGLNLKITILYVL
jgi:hypothetical protein